MVRMRDGRRIINLLRCGCRGWGGMRDGSQVERFCWVVGGGPTHHDGDRDEWGTDASAVMAFRRKLVFEMRGLRLGEGCGVERRFLEVWLAVPGRREMTLPTITFAALR